MAKTVEETGRETAVQDVLRELHALPKEATNADVFAVLAKLPRRPPDWTSADVIREARGPLPEDDPLFDDRRR